MQLKEKAEAREKERLKMEEKKAKKRESSFRQLLKCANPPLSAESNWEEVRRQPFVLVMMDILSEYPLISYTHTHTHACFNSHQVRSQFEQDPAFEAFTEEVERVRVFKEFVKTIKVCLICHIWCQSWNIHSICNFSGTVVFE